MTKPVVFFSHSSKDSKPLGLLKDQFVQATGGTIDVFLSSDGQSIPLGRNWVHSIEEALNTAKLMFIFVTENSLRSNWIFFESGFAYSKGIRVIPVAFLNADLAQLVPPLSLLQGFNIKSEEGLNNILAVVNDVFDHSHKPYFTPGAYQGIAGLSHSIKAHALGMHGMHVQEVLLTILRVNTMDIDQASELRRVRSFLESAKIEVAVSWNALNLPGSRIQFETDEQNGPQGPQATLKMWVDPGTSSVNLAIASKLLQTVTGGATPLPSLTCRFSPTVLLEPKSFVVSGKLSDLALLIGHGYFQVGEITFSLTSEPWSENRSPGVTRLEVVASGNRFPTTEEVRNLIDLFFERGILRFEGE